MKYKIRHKKYDKRFMFEYSHQIITEMIFSQHYYDEISFHFFILNVLK
jgi:hypothetical protein